jgi:trehalose 6-phosphate phosphatase
VPDLIYAGNHGMEVCGGGLHFLDPAAKELQGTMGQISEVLAAGLRSFPGVEVEYKGLTTTVHFRRTPDDLTERLRQIVEDALHPVSDRFLCYAGQKCMEVRPRAGSNKGAAAQWIRARLGRGRTLSIYFGDDTTDEDAFRALAEGVTVKVGERAPTAAHYYVRGPGEVTEFLERLVGALAFTPVDEGP